MSYALIDNASLTAAQRVLGEVHIKNSDTINGDLVAFENLLQAILFYDDLICIDNYKSAFRESRARRFPFIRFVAPGDHNLGNIEQAAQQEAARIRPEIRGGEFANEDFREFLRLLKMNIVCTWDLASSVYYLTMKMLGSPSTDEFSKYSELSASIFAELTDAAETRGRWSTESTLIASNGRVHMKEEMERAAKGKSRGFGGTTRALDMFVAALNWIAYKTIYYSMVSRYFRADSFLHPIRHAFQIHWMKNSGVYGHDFTSKLVAAMSSDIGTTVGQVIDSGRTSTVSIEVPLFSAYLASKSGGVESAIDEALRLKSDSAISTVRGVLREIRTSFDEQGLASANKRITKWQDELRKASAATRAKYGIRTAQGVPSSVLMNVYNAIASIGNLPSFPDFGFHVPLPTALQSATSKGFSSMYKDVTNELTKIERLGSLRDLLARGFVFHEDSGLFSGGPKVEDPKYRWHESDWKIPM